MATGTHTNTRAQNHLARLSHLTVAAGDPAVQADDTVTAHAGMGGQGVPIPLVYNGWVQNLPNKWKKLLTAKQINPIGPVAPSGTQTLAVRDKEK
jgi:hypothetical protein